ncbi:MAG: GGDEF domain-containing protein [Deltaproteobacteria bacterium]|jgi:diguanylate cyclase (GGDEF)-like protein|nr:GGDEF domain-containing protein [Deltaproteobacteria bacterium]MDA8298667.1 GGDEF domain-containing protein [Deltaproteobacteria bacterium]
MALTDGLTGLYNRRYFDMFYENIFNQSSRYGIPLTLIMCDIDHFKKINDTYGHDKGDIVLKEISNILKSNTRKTDIASRFGGEEFILCLPSTEITSALDVARKIKQMVLNVKTKDIKKVTVSMGVTFYRTEFDSNPTGLLKRLDDLLYEAKKRGRNRIISEDHAGDIIEVEENPWLDE